MVEQFQNRKKIRKRMKAVGDCWEWQGYVNNQGYGVINVDKPILAHRMSYTAFVGEIPEGKVLDHICRNRKCVNPAHLRILTIGENVLCGETIAAKKKAQTHCIHGHPFDDENTYFYKGRRQCRTCRRENDLKHKAKLAVAMKGEI